MIDYLILRLETYPQATGTRPTKVTAQLESMRLSWLRIDDRQHDNNVRPDATTRD